MKYNLYAGLEGGFGGATYQGTGEFNTMFEAEREARAFAEAIYESYEGSHGLFDWYDIAEENDLDFDQDEHLINILYQEQLDLWLDYYAIPFDEDEILPEEVKEL